MTATFRLDDTFVGRYTTLTPPFGFNGLGELACLRTYSRLKDDGTQERWFETVRRVVEGTYRMQERWVRSHHLPWKPGKAQRSAQEMYDRMFWMKFLPPGRGLWAMGSELTESRGMFAALLNCGFVSTRDLAKDPTEPFTFLMEASMLGIGVGFDTLGAGTVPVLGPDCRPEAALSDLVIPDTREGWIGSVKLLLGSYLQGWNHVTFDYSEIRPAGAPIKGFGGTAAGADPLRELHAGLRAMLDLRVGQALSSRDITDVMNLIGKCVVSGNVRRTAEIAFGDAADAEFLDLKDYERHPEREAFGWTSNNSVFAELGMDYGPAAARVARNGEPGFAWLENMQCYGRMGDPMDFLDARAAGTNPCVEQTLESFECCNLVETFPAAHESIEDYKRTLKFAYLYAKTVTLGTTPWAKTNQIMLRNRRIGLSQSGIQQAVAKFGIDEYRTLCRQGYATVRQYDTMYSEWLGIPKSIKVTSVKPSGTVSLLAGATPGMHWPEAKYYIRRMRLANNSGLLPALARAGYVIEPAFGSEATSVVVEVPVEVPGDLRTVGEVSMWEQLSMAAFLQREWADNQVSATITFDPATEGPQIAHALTYFQYQLKGVSFLPRVPQGAYRQMPYEAIDRTTYLDRVSTLTAPDFGATAEAAEAERFCDSSSCTI
jgi:adenosylcobalamin-dependent ribonucleoside-triphosphate reductase